MPDLQLIKQTMSSGLRPRLGQNVEGGIFYDLVLYSRVAPSACPGEKLIRERKKANTVFCGGAKCRLGQALGIARAAVSQSRVKNQLPLGKHKLRDRRPTEKALCRILSRAGSHSDGRSAELRDN